MVDTLKLRLVDYQIEPKNSVVVQPSPYMAGTGELLSNFNLWADTETGEIVQGSKAYYNDPKINVTLSPHGEETSCHVQLSLPRYSHDNNYFPVDKETAAVVLNNLEKRLGTVGIKTNIDQAHISRIDLFKTIQTEERFRDYSGVFRLLRAQRTHTRDYGTTFLWCNSEKELCVYDKIVEMKLNGDDVSKYPENSMRFEYRLKKPRKIRKSLCFDTVGELKKEYGVLSEVFLGYIGSDLFKYDMKEVEVMCGDEIEGGLRYFKDLGDRYYRNNFLKTVGLMKLLEMAEYDTIKEAFLNVACNRMAESRIVRELDNLKANGAFLHKDPNSIKTYAVLYDEMKEKILRVA
jgi:hypothetical protein